MNSEPPEEAHYRNELHLLSPASPKPIHFPAPSNIPVLEMQMDVGFNQTEAHMNDPAMHNTDVRPDFWRDPAEKQQLKEQEEKEAQEQQEAGQSSPYSTGADEAAEVVEEMAEEVSLSNTQPLQPSNEEPMPKTQLPPTSSTPYAPADAADVDATSGDPLLPVDEARPEQAQSESAPNTSSVDVNALLNDFQTSPITTTQPAHDSEPLASQTQQPLPPTIDPSPISAAGLGVPPSGLPPRPPPQEQPLIHPNYVHSQHIRDYHPHAANPAFHATQAGLPGTVADSASRSHVSHAAHSPSSANASLTTEHALPSAGVTGTYTYPQQISPTSALPPAPGQALHTPASATSPFASNTPIESRRERALAAGQTPTAEDRPWDASVQRKYDNFIEAERGYVSEGRWEQFPHGSRLFVGNLSSEKVTKRDIFHVFHPYGDLAQISIKQAYGFVQFLRVEDCARALAGEQGTQIRDKRIHLEVSKPQKNRVQNNNSTNNAVRRSRSPEYSNRGKAPLNVDRYVSGNDRNGGRREAPRRSGGYRSPSPRGGYRDRYDDRYRTRSPDYARGARYRSPSPVRRSEDDELPLPKRAPRDVPDVQILVLDTLEREFISWVEKAFSSRNVRVDVLLLSPRLSEQAVVRRQIVEGVVAVSKLTRVNQQTGKIGLQIFNRAQGGAVGNVTFEEYDGLDPPICAELVLRAKSTQAASAPAPSYGGNGGYASQYAPPSAPVPQYGYGAGQYSTQQGPAYQQQQSSYGQPPQVLPPATAPPNLQNLITSLDPNGLQSLLSAMSQQQQTPQTSGNGASGVYNPHQSQPGSAQFAPPGHFGQQQAQAMAALQQNPALAGMVSQHHHQQQQQQQGQAQPGGSQVNMQDILARLGTYNKQ